MRPSDSNRPARLRELADLCRARNLGFGYNRRVHEERDAGLHPFSESPTKHSISQAETGESPPWSARQGETFRPPSFFGLIEPMAPRQTTNQNIRSVTQLAVLQRMAHIASAVSVSTSTFSTCACVMVYTPPNSLDYVTCRLLRGFHSNPSRSDTLRNASLVPYSNIRRKHAAWRS